MTRTLASDFAPTRPRKASLVACLPNCGIVGICIRPARGLGGQADALPPIPEVFGVGHRPK